MEQFRKIIEEEQNIIFISSYKIKQELIKNFSNKLRKVVFKSFEEVKKEIYPNISYDMLVNNMQSNTNLEVLKIKLSNSYFITCDSHDGLLHELFFYHQKNHMDMKQNMLFYYQSKKIYLVNYYYDDDLINQFLKCLSNVESIFTHQGKNKLVTIYQFENYENEILKVVNDIAILLHEGIMPSKIVIEMPNDNYLKKLKEYFMIYQIDYIISSKASLFSLDSIKIVYNYLLSCPGKNLNETLKSYLAENQNPFVTKILQALEPIIILDLTIDDICLSLIKDALSCTFYQDEKTTNAILIENIFDHIYDEDTHVFLLNFSHGEVLHIYKDDNYLKDDIRKKLCLLTSFDKTKKEEQKILDFLNYYPNLHISFAKTDGESFYNLSPLVEKLKINGDVEFVFPKIHIYDIVCRQMAKLRFLKAFHIYQLYQEKNADYIEGYAYFKDCLDDFYDSSFKATLKDLDLKKQPLTLSYTKLNDYFSCPFRFYVKYILNIQEKLEDNNSLFVGSMYHYVLEKVIRKIYLESKKQEEVLGEIDTYILEFIKKENSTLDDKRNFYFQKFVKFLHQEITILLDFMDHSKFCVYGLEQKLEKILDEKTKLIGLIDKILKYEDYYVVIDYKTNPVKPSWNALDVGVDLQIPLYLLLLQATYKDAKIAGGYLQSIYQSSQFPYIDQSLFEKLKEESRYSGYTIQDKKLIIALDTKAEDIPLSLPKQIFAKNGFHKNFLKKSLSEEEFNKVISYVYDLIVVASHKIRDGVFPITPLVNEKNESVCRYCKLQDICFKSDYMKKSYTKHSDLSYILERGSHQNEVE